MKNPFARPGLATAAAIIAVMTLSHGVALAQPDSKSGVNVGTLSCKVAGGVGFVFGSSKDLECVFTRSGGGEEFYTGSIKRFGVDIGYTKEARILWVVFAPGTVAKGALAGDYGGVTASVTAGVGVGANVLVGGGDKQVSLQPVSVEGSVGLNVAAGIGEVTLVAR